MQGAFLDRLGCSLIGLNSLGRDHGRFIYIYMLIWQKAACPNGSRRNDNFAMSIVILRYCCHLPLWAVLFCE